MREAGTASVEEVPGAATIGASSQDTMVLVLNGLGTDFPSFPAILHASAYAGAKMCTPKTLQTADEAAAAAADEGAETPTARGMRALLVLFALGVDGADDDPDAGGVDGVPGRDDEAADEAGAEADRLRASGDADDDDDAAPLECGVTPSKIVADGTADRSIGAGSAAAFHAVT